MPSNRYPFHEIKKKRERGRKARKGEKEGREEREQERRRNDPEMAWSIREERGRE